MGYPSRSLTELPTHLALKKGFFRSEGLDMKLVQARSNILAAALASGSMHYLTSVTTVLGAIMGGLPAKVIAGVTKEYEVARSNELAIAGALTVVDRGNADGQQLAVGQLGQAVFQRTPCRAAARQVTWAIWHPVTKAKLASDGRPKMSFSQAPATPLVTADAAATS